MNLDWTEISPDIWRLLLDLLIGGIAGYLVFFVARGLEQNKKDAEIARLSQELANLRSRLQGKHPARKERDRQTERDPGKEDDLGWPRRLKSPVIQSASEPLPDEVPQRWDILNPILVSLLVLAILAARAIFDIPSNVILTTLGILFVAGLLITWYKNRRR